jgi:hypothetical protein
MRLSVLAAVSIYAAGAFLTGAHYTNHRCDEIELRVAYQCGKSGVIAGAFWPAYWAGRGAIEVTK